MTLPMLKKIPGIVVDKQIDYRLLRVQQLEVRKQELKLKMN